MSASVVDGINGVPGLVGVGVSSVFVARQPVFTRDLRLFGYELLFRASAGTHTAEVIDDDAATRKLLLDTFTVIGLGQLVGDRRAMINVGRDYLLQEADSPILPPHQVVLELLESIDADDDVLRAMEQLRRRGFRLCLDDFEPTDAKLPLLDHADMVKMEVDGRSVDEVACAVDSVKRPGIKLLAEKIESRERFRDCLDLGFHYFQGYFLSRPRTVRGTSVPTHRLPTLRLLAAIQKPELELPELERIIASDVGLSYRLLRYMNSAYYRLHKPIDSIRHAILYLGEREMRRWASLMAIAAVDDQPAELISLLTVRARMCELIGRGFHGGNGDAFFTVGLFSGLDIVLETSLEDVVAELPLSHELKQALLQRVGPAGRVLDSVLHYEVGDWDWLELEGYPAPEMIQAYLDAIDWSRQVFSQEGNGQSING